MSELLISLDDSNLLLMKYNEDCTDTDHDGIKPAICNLFFDFLRTTNLNASVHCKAVEYCGNDRKPALRLLLQAFMPFLKQFVKDRLADLNIRISCDECMSHVRFKTYTFMKELKPRISSRQI